MKTILALTLIGGLAALAPAPAQAALGLTAVPPTTTAEVIPVSGGCGPYGFRDRFGYCRPAGGYRPAPPPPPPYYRRCPYGTFPTPYGCRYR